MTRLVLLAWHTTDPGLVQ